MEDIDIEQQEPLPVDRDGRPLRNAGDEPDSSRKMGCCEKFQHSVSKWMLPADVRSKYLERANCCPPPIFIILISIAELAVFIYYAVWKPQKQWVTLEEGIWKSRLTYKPECRQQAWRFISYMFVHAGVEHIVGNLVMQLLVGIPLELVHKGFEVGMVYLAGVLAGSLASSIFDPLSALVGASGGVYALIGGYFMNAVVNFREMIPVLGVFRILAIVIFGMLSCMFPAYFVIFLTAVITLKILFSPVATDFGFAFYRRFVSDDAGMKVSFVAHFAGIVAGMTIGYVFFSAYNKKLLKDPRFWLCILGYVAFVIFAVVFNIFLTPAT
ncbi:rhomboid-related protein 2 isoform X1 [Epinephelus fuscoguttatus]|uniref:rhomboid-related protein 2 isoform X1 n=1 Tax=Epinephelus fuscoguttatus TaxID=293821 RepID=UPI0020D08339|nr:rhomboid-related protein 2 isoform X1 [Epinephelus fuscoguttatus]XP_049440354.1 rhomboid-related protein 2 isoform X1 [Epinephelus fuscoguttatus]